MLQREYKRLEDKKHIGMKEITTYGDNYKNYNVKYDDSYKKFESYKRYVKYYMSADPFEESEEERVNRLAREKAIERNKRIDSILG